MERVVIWSLIRICIYFQVWCSFLFASYLAFLLSKGSQSIWFINKYHIDIYHHDIIIIFINMIMTFIWTKGPPFTAKEVFKGWRAMGPLLPHATPSITQKLWPDKALESPLLHLTKASALKWYSVSLNLCLSGCIMYFVMVNFRYQFV